MNSEIKNLLFLPNDIDRSSQFVLHILEPEPKGEIGGADLHVLDLSIAQKEKGFYKPIVLINQNEEYANRLKACGIPYIAGHLLGSNYKIMKAINNLNEYLNIRLIHSHGYDANYFTFLFRLINRKNWGEVPCVMTCHGWVENTFKNRFKTWLDFKTYKIAQAFIVVSKQGLKRMDKYSSEKIVEYIPNGIFIQKKGTKTFQLTHDLNKINIPSNKKVITYVGRLSGEKRLDILFKAFNIINKEVKNTFFVIVGSGPEREFLELKAKEYKIHNILFTGMINNVRDVLNESKLFMMSSDTEGTPRAALEAMSTSLPIVATNVGGMSSLIKHGINGYLVNKQDFNSLAKFATILLINDNHRKELGSLASKKVVEEFSITIMQEKTEKLYKKIIN